MMKRVKFVELLADMPAASAFAAANSCSADSSIRALFPDSGGYFLVIEPRQFNSEADHELADGFRRTVVSADFSANAWIGIPVALSKTEICFGSGNFVLRWREFRDGAPTQCR